MKIRIRSGPTGFSVRANGNGKPCSATVDGDLTSTTTKKLSPSAIFDDTKHSLILEERKRIARDLHDILAQSFTSILIQIELAEEMLLKGRPETRQHLLRMRQLARKGLIDVRRALFGLQPRSWEKCCLVEAMEQLKAEFNAAGDGVRAEFSRRESMPDLPMAIQGHVLCIAQESLTNVLKHASATRVRVELIASLDSLELNIVDNGAGFDPSKMGMPGGLGIRGMQERAGLMGGRLSVSSRAGRGTRVRLTVPLEAGNQRKKTA